MFFGARHGKGPADGGFGHIKSAAKRAVKGRRVTIWKAREFAQFCKSQFHHISYDETRKEPQYFMQEFFYIEDIMRDEFVVVAVMTEHTCSSFSIHSTGRFCVIEVREVSCCCESCLFINGKECPNQAYASKWKAINLHTGKALLEDNFQNLHWDLTATIESNAKSNDESNI